MKIKSWVTVSLFIFWAAVTAILTAGLVYYQNNKQQSSVSQNINLGNSLQPGQTITLSTAEIAKHSTFSDCWMILNNKVYDLTSFLSAHPGGAGTMTPYCGKDGSQAYQTKDMSPARGHSQSAYNLLPSYYIGDLNQKITSSQLNSNLQNVQTQGQNAAQNVQGYDD
jgi:cytochrome b involved in lipid metabolism